MPQNQTATGAVLLSPERAELREKIKELNHLKKRGEFLAICCGCVLWGASLPVLLLHQNQRLSDVTTFVLVLLICCVGGCIGFPGVKIILQFRRECLRARKESNLLALGSTIEILNEWSNRGKFGQSQKVQSVMTEALLSMLPQLQPGDADLLSPQHYAMLLKQLRGANATLTCAILGALENIGDQRALPFVEKLAAGAWTAQKDTLVREAAQTCLTALRERIQQEQDSDLLLRAADKSAFMSSSLLRPGSAESVADASSLLRAVTAQENAPEGSTNQTTAHFHSS